MWKVGDAIEGRWQVQKIMGGGFGVVYIVHDPELKQAFAAKSVHPDLAGEVVHERFEQEAYTWLKLERHPHVVQAHFLHKNMLFLEYVGGGDLSDWIGTPRLLEDRRWCLQLALDFCSGMQHAYARGVRAHRDVKPSNCLLTDEGRLKVTDFGLISVLEGNAKARQLHERNWAERLAADEVEPGPELTEESGSLGTVTHMAPEQIREARAVDARADIYSFGIMLYEMLVGRLPFQGHSALSYLYHHTHTPAPTLQLDWPADVSQDLAVLIAACLEKEPERRPPSFGMLEQVLRDIYRRVAGGEEPAASPPSAAGDGFDLSCRGVSLVNLGLYAEGLELLEQAVQVDPKLHAAWVNRSLALQKLGRHQEAVTSCDVALRLESSSAAYHLKALALHLGGRHQEAEKAFRRSLDLNPANVRAWIDQGLFFGACDCPGPALDSFESALRLAPRQPEPYTGKALVLANLGQVEDALACFGRSLSLDPRQPKVLLDLADYYYSLELDPEAEAFYSRALGLDGTLARAWLGLGRLRTRERDYAQALALLGKALEFDGELQLAWYVLGSNLLMLGSLDDAAQTLRMAVKFGPRDADAWNNLGACEYQLKNLDTARECFRMAAQLGHEGAAQNYRALAG